MKKIVIIILSVLLLAGIGAGVYFFFIKGDKEESTKNKKVVVTAELIEKASIEIPEVSTNLESENYAVVQVHVVFKDEDAKHEGEIRQPQLVDEIIRTLNTSTADELKDLDKFSVDLTDKFNKMIGEHENKVVKVMFKTFKVQ